MVVGARSAVFAPVPDLGLIVVDEEHEAPTSRRRARATTRRDVAVMRGEARGRAGGARLGHAVARVVRERAARASTSCLALPARIGAAGPAAGRGRGPARRCCRPAAIPILTPPLREALAQRLARERAGAAAAEPPRLRHEPALPRVRAAGRRAPTARCSLTLHQRRARRRCATTAATRRARPRACASCKGEYLRLTGYGTEKVVEAVQAALPDGARGAPRPRPAPRAAARSQKRAGRVRGGGDRHPGGHADDRQGPRLPARDAGGRGRRRRGPGPARLPRRRAHVPAAHPGRGPRRAAPTCRARSSCRATCPTTTRCAWPAPRTTRPSSSARWSSAAPWPTRRRRRW